MISKVNKNNLGLGISLVVAILLLGAALADAGEPVEKSGDAAANGIVKIENIVGSLQVEGWDRNEIHIEGTLGDDVEDLIFKTGGKKSHIKVVYPKKARNLDDGADLVIKVPRGSKVDVEGVSASVDIKGIEGEVYASSVSGDVTVLGDCHEIEAASISGDVTVIGDAPEMDLQSISGRVELDGDCWDLDAQTVSGRIELDLRLISEVSVESVSGDVRIRGELDPKGDISCDIHSGDLTLILAGDVQADFEVDTFSGDIDSEFGGKAHRTSKYAPGKEFEFTVGGGGARVRINTFSGDVEILKK